MWVARKKPAFQPYKVSFSPQRWNEKAWQLYRICGRMPLKSTLFCFGHPFFNILRLFSRRRGGPHRRCVNQQATVTNSQEISVATMRSSGQCMPSARRLPITAVAHTSSTATVPQRRRGHSSPAASSASWRRTSCDPTGKQSLSLSASACVKTAECPAPAPAGHAPV